MLCQLLLDSFCTIRYDGRYLLFLHSTIFFPLAKILLENASNTSQVSWGILLLFLFLSEMLGVAYLFCWASWIKNITELGHVWERGI